MRRRCRDFLPRRPLAGLGGGAAAIRIARRRDVDCDHVRLFELGRRYAFSACRFLGTLLLFRHFATVLLIRSSTTSLVVLRSNPHHSRDPRSNVFQLDSVRTWANPPSRVGTTWGADYAKKRECH